MGTALKTGHEEDALVAGHSEGSGGGLMPDLDPDAIWTAASDRLRIVLSEGKFSAWFESTKAASIEDDVLVLAVPTTFVKDWIEARYLGPLTQAVTEAAGRALSVALVTDESLASEPTGETHSAIELDEVPPEVELTREAPLDSPHFHPKYNFDSFVIGSSNRFAHAAALAVAEAPAQAYNPLFIYGGAGLGKTHLLQAVGRYVQECHSDLVVRYVSTEQFMNDFIVALQRRTIPDFHRRYRAADLLLVDDIQFLEGKERLQEEFFHTFNSLHPKSQIVITSDRPPKKISTLEERLSTRFEWGLITDIQPPDLETRLAILIKNSETERLAVPSDVLSFIASRIQTNIRALEGALIRVVAYASLTRSDITLELAQGVLQSLLPDAREARVTSDLVLAVAAEYFDVKPEEICSASRSRPLVVARQMAMYLCRELTDLSLPKIGERFGGRDHSTVVHAMKKVRAQMHEEKESYEQVRELTTRIRQQAGRA
ncbi:MAG TPA: chromosomal replication initiator protein DnaA [Actinomycetota bacterium]|nr:chromosomal replication initiator protein DnaA [Actinomycetota bacterium]